MMLNRNTSVAAAVCAALAAGGVGLAQASGRAAPATDSSNASAAQGSSANHAAAQAYRALRASNLIGMNVRGANGEGVGDIKDLVVDVKSGQVRYAVLQFDPGILSGERLVPVPVHRLRMGRQGDELRYDVERDQIERTAIRQGDLDNRLLADATRMGELDRAWGLDRGYAHTPKTKGQASASGRTLRLASTLLGKPVVGRAEQSVGYLDELVIDMASRRVHYAVVALDRAWAGTEKRVVLPLAALQPTPGSEPMVLHAQKARLQAMPEFDAKRYANLNDASLRSDVNRWLSAARVTAQEGSASGPVSPDTRTSGAAGAPGAGVKQ